MRVSGPVAVPYDLHVRDGVHLYRYGCSRAMSSDLRHRVKESCRIRADKAAWGLCASAAVLCWQNRFNTEPRSHGDERVSVRRAARSAARGRNDPAENESPGSRAIRFPPDRPPTRRAGYAGRPAELGGPHRRCRSPWRYPRRDKNSVDSAALFARRGAGFHRRALKKLDKVRRGCSPGPRVRFDARIGARADDAVRANDDRTV